MRVLVAGGAGYIGSDMVRALLGAGHEPVVFDNFATGHPAAVGSGVALVEGDLLDPEALRACFAAHAPDAVMHFSARSLVAESMVAPTLYCTNNVSGTLNLVETMRVAGVDGFVFSSIAALFGDPETVPLPDDAPVRPINPYRASKWMVEQILADCDRAYGPRFVTLRYFNAAGAAVDGTLGEDHRPETHLIPLVLQTALGRRPSISVYGSDYPTEDGTCIRDYIPIEDLCAAHLLALDHLAAGGESRTYNLGNGRGFSVRAVSDAVQRVTGDVIGGGAAARRPGDPEVLVADSARIRADLGWKPTYPQLETIVTHALEWHRTHPDGFDTDVPATAEDPRVPPSPLRHP